MNLVFHFGNDETHMCFTWLIERKLGWTLQKLEAAYEVPVDDHNPIAISTSHAVRELLAESLESGFLEGFDDGSEDDESLLEIGYNGTGEPPLSMLLLELAFQRICFETVAEAVMRHHRKWAPDQERPEFK